MANKSYEDMVRDGKNESYLEQIIRDRVRSGERVIDSKLVQFLLDEISSLRRVIYYDKSLDCAIEGKKRDLDEACQTYELLNEINLRKIRG